MELSKKKRDRLANLLGGLGFIFMVIFFFLSIAGSYAFIMVSYNTIKGEEKNVIWAIRICIASMLLWKGLWLLADKIDPYIPTREEIMEMAKQRWYVMLRRAILIVLFLILALSFVINNFSLIFWMHFATILTLFIAWMMETILS